MARLHDASRGHLPLTAMQRKVLRLCSLGCTVKEVSQVLGLRPSTVDRHKTRAMARIGARNLAEVTRNAIEAGISPPNDRLTEAERSMLDRPGDE